MTTGEFIKWFDQKSNTYDFNTEEKEYMQKGLENIAISEGIKGKTHPNKIESAKAFAENYQEKIIKESDTIQSKIRGSFTKRIETEELLKNLKEINKEVDETSKLVEPRELPTKIKIKQAKIRKQMGKVESLEVDIEIRDAFRAESVSELRSLESQIERAEHLTEKQKSLKTERIRKGIEELR